MSHASRFAGKLLMPYGLSHALIYNDSDERGTVVALFTDKTLCDKACNEFNATIG